MRARNLKPGFFRNPELAELPVEARLLFAGLWCMADKAGRLEDRPRKIKIELFPADTFEVEPLLEALEGKRLILRYVVEGVGFIQVVNFGKHQNPHKTESESKIPAPPGYGNPSAPPLYNGSTTVTSPLEHGSRPADSLIPDSLIPDSSSLRSERARKPSRKCPEDFVPSAALRDAMRTECPSVDLDRETAKFRDHTFGTARSDWDGTWRNWIRKAADMAPAGKKFASEPSGELSALKARARAIGFRDIHAGESVSVYRDHLVNAETARKSSGPMRAVPTLVRQ